MVYKITVEGPAGPALQALATHVRRSVRGDFDGKVVPDFTISTVEHFDSIDAMFAESETTD